jgi:hypothetical protein
VGARSNWQLWFDNACLPQWISPPDKQQLESVRNPQKLIGDEGQHVPDGRSVRIPNADRVAMEEIPENSEDTWDSLVDLSLES